MSLQKTDSISISDLPAEQPNIELDKASTASAKSYFQSSSEFSKLYLMR